MKQVNMMSDDQSMEDILEDFGSESQIQNARREVFLFEESDRKHTQEKRKSVKDYPKVQREIDLHGHTAPEALRAMEWFIEGAIRQRVRTVRIVTGRGSHSKNLQAVLPQMTEDFLVKLRRQNAVLDFKKEKTGGAFVVYLVS